MSKINRMSQVTLYYQLGLADEENTILEDCFDGDPVTIQLGVEEMAEGLELSLLNLEAGEEQTIEIGPELGFGYSDETMFHSLPRTEFSPEQELEPGLIIEFNTPNDEMVPGTIIEFDDKEVKVDFNHPLAGRTLRYRVKIVEVVNVDDEGVLN